MTWADRQALARAERDYLEPPYERDMPDSVEDRIGLVFWQDGDRKQIESVGWDGDGWLYTLTGGGEVHEDFLDGILEEDAAERKRCAQMVADGLEVKAREEEFGDEFVDMVIRGGV